MLPYIFAQHHCIAPSSFMRPDIYVPHTYAPQYLCDRCSCAEISRHPSPYVSQPLSVPAILHLCYVICVSPSVSRRPYQQSLELCFGRAIHMRGVVGRRGHAAVHALDCRGSPVIHAVHTRDNLGVNAGQPWDKRGTTAGYAHGRGTNAGQPRDKRGTSAVHPRDSRMPHTV